MHGGSGFPTSLATLIIVFFFLMIAILLGVCEGVAHCGEHDILLYSFDILKTLW